MRGVAAAAARAASTRGGSCRAAAPDLVIGVGGYSSGPVVLAAALRGIPTLLLEQNAVPGLTNRLLARVVSAAAVTFESTAAYFGRRGFVAGNPVRPEFLSDNAAARRARRGAAEDFDLWRLPGRARDQRGHGGGGAAAGSPPWRDGNHASDRRARSGTRHGRLPARGARGPGRAVPVRHGPGNEGRPISSSAAPARRRSRS